MLLPIELEPVIRFDGFNSIIVKTFKLGQHPHTVLWIFDIHGLGLPASYHFTHNLPGADVGVFQFLHHAVRFYAADIDQRVINRRDVDFIKVCHFFFTFRLFNGLMDKFLVFLAELLSYNETSFIETWVRLNV